MYTEMGTLRRRRERKIKKALTIIFLIITAFGFILSALNFGLERGKDQKTARQEYMCKYYGKEINNHFKSTKCK